MSETRSSRITSDVDDRNGPTRVPVTRPPGVLRGASPRTRRAERGQALVELALITPILFALLLGTVDLGRVFYAMISVTNAAREGAQAAALDLTSYVAGAACASNNKVVCAATREPQNSFVTVGPSDISLTCNPSCAATYGSAVTVTVTGHFDPITPVVQAIVGSQHLTLSSHATATVVIVPNSAGTPVTPPGAPTGVTGLPGNGQVTVSWTAPASNGGSPITTYTVSASPGGQTCTTGGTLSCTVSGLTNNTNYTFTVVATNASGNGPASTASAAVTPASLPDPPYAIYGVAGNGQVTVAWTAPDSTGGYPVTGYTVTSAPGGQTCTTTGATSCVVSGLTNGTAYTFTATATTMIGTGLASSASPPVTPSTNPGAVPGAPGGVAATVTGSTQAQVTWTAASTNGGGPVTLYTVNTWYYISVFNWGWLTGHSCTTTGALACTVTGLSSGAQYKFTVTATNAGGTGPQSAASAPLTISCSLPSASFTSSQSKKQNPVLFTSTSTPTSGQYAINYWRWDYGDGGVDAGNLSTASHNYGVANRGLTFTVTLSVTNACGTVSRSQSVTTLP